MWWAIAHLAVGWVLSELFLAGARARPEVFPHRSIKWWYGYVGSLLAWELMLLLAVIGIVLGRRRRR